MRPWREGLELKGGDQLFVWGDAPLPPEAQSARVVRVEDGFVRSVGLGAALAPPVSWVFDSKGLHHWGHVATDLEDLLGGYECSRQDMERGKELIRLWRDLRLSKYNLAHDAQVATDWAAPQTPGSRLRLLAIGQVASDAALRGIRDTPVRSNIDLLRTLRQRYPGAFIAYKRHPDVVAGLRDGEDRDADRYADAIIDNVGLRALLWQFDQVHVINSLAGFEALLLGANVVCHALPFYAGWGLTQDEVACPRRSRQRSLEELAWIALGLYPRYWCARSRRLVDAATAFKELASLRQRSHMPQVRTLA
ncbi:MAG: hypothetical protein N2690_11510, partial [Rhodocyclaceae bacterium]|nr:hypothetical protein [Rhodocyclaceae bacterium]